MPRLKKPINRKPLHIRTGDDVIVISGASRSNTPRKVLSVLPRENKVLVEGVNIMKDRPKNKGAGARPSGINSEEVVAKPFPIHRSKVMLIDPKSKTRTRVAIKVQDGKRVRVASKSGESL